MWAAAGLLFAASCLAGDFSHLFWDEPRWRGDLDTVYAARRNETFWLAHGQLTPAARSLLDEMENAHRRGLLRADYDSTPLATLVRSCAQAPGCGADTPRIDRAISLNVMRFVSDLHFGRVGRNSRESLRIARTPLDWSDVFSRLRSSAGAAAALDALEPQFGHYQLLKAALAKYQAMPPSTQQRRHVMQIQLSMERIRWLPSPTQSPPIIVNIPQFRLFAFQGLEDSAASILQMDVIVGSTFPGRRTPVFAAEMRSVVLNPYWDVPRSIALAELLPKARKDAAWLDRNGYQLVDGPADASSVVPATAENVGRLAAGTLRVRQLPGPNNALGRVKFLLPNPYNVYLHDTPAPELFRRSRRAFSHGCIRLADPMRLLHMVLADQPEWSPARVSEALATGRPVRIALRTVRPVYILYGTALALEDGRTLFFDDIYRLDAPLWAELTSRHP